jgi:ketosteroid isomerase-like protein
VITSDSTISSVIHEYRDAVFEKNVDSFIALYERNARIFDMWGTWAYPNAAAWRDSVAGWFTSLGVDQVAVDFEEVYTLEDQDLAVVHAFVTYSEISAGGTSSRAMANRLTWTLRRSETGWKIAHEHTSAPVDFKTSKVILQRAS